jgi:hypothetical protein
MMMDKLDREFERFKIRFEQALRRTVQSNVPHETDAKFAEILANPDLREGFIRSLRILEAKVEAELQQIMQAPELRASFVRSVFANDQKLPDVQNIRSRLRKR